MPLNDTTKVCNRCHETKPLDQFTRNKRETDGRNRWCKPCHNAYRRDRYQSDDAYRATVIEESNRQHAVRQQSPELCEKLNKQRREHYHSRANDTEWRQSERLRLSSYKRVQRRTNPLWHAHDLTMKRRFKAKPEQRDRAAAYSRTYYQQRYRHNPAYRRRCIVNATIQGRTRRARMALAPGSHTFAQWQQVCKRYNYRCLCCGARKPLNADHIVPIARGGSNDIDNIQPLCFTCNRSKSAKTIDYRGLWDIDIT